MLAVLLDAKNAQIRLSAQTASQVSHLLVPHVQLPLFGHAYKEQTLTVLSASLILK